MFLRYALLKDFQHMNIAHFVPYGHRSTYNGKTIRAHMQYLFTLISIIRLHQKFKIPTRHRLGLKINLMAVK